MPTRKTVRKTVGWSIFALLVLLMVVQVPCIASRMCFNAGRKLYAVRKYQSAAFAYRSSVALDGNFAQGYVQLGSAYLALKKYPQAESAFLTAKRIRDDSYATVGLGMVHHVMNRNDEAEKEFHRAISLNPTDSYAYDQLAKMHYDLGKYLEAIDGFKQVLTMAQTSQTYVILGNSYVYAREYEPGVESYKQALQLDPKNEAAHFQLAVAYGYLERYEEAAAEYKEVLK